MCSCLRGHGLCLLELLDRVRGSLCDEGDLVLSQGRHIRPLHHVLPALRFWENPLNDAPVHERAQDHGLSEGDLPFRHALIPVPLILYRGQLAPLASYENPLRYPGGPGYERYDGSKHPARVYVLAAQLLDRRPTRPYPPPEAVDVFIYLRLQVVLIVGSQLRLRIDVHLHSLGGGLPKHFRRPAHSLSEVLHEVRDPLQPRHSVHLVLHEAVRDVYHPGPMDLLLPHPGPPEKDPLAGARQELVLLRVREVYCVHLGQPEPGVRRIGHEFGHRGRPLGIYGQVHQALRPVHTGGGGPPGPPAGNIRTGPPGPPPRSQGRRGTPGAPEGPERGPHTVLFPPPDPPA